MARAARRAGPVRAGWRVGYAAIGRDESADGEAAQRRRPRTPPRPQALLLLLLLAHAAAHDPPDDHAASLAALEDAADTAADPGAAPGDVRAATRLLSAAAGVLLDDPAAADAPTEPLEGSWPGLGSAPGGNRDPRLARPALAALAAAARDPGAALALHARAAALGEPAGHAAVGTALVTGARPGGPKGTRPTLAARDWPAALAHLYFAAAGNDTLAAMALGAAHAAGAGVPKSCAAAVLYYAQAADAAVAAARSPAGLPVADRSRLGTARSRLRPSRDQEVLHYQWFADLGNAGAQRALGQLLAADARGAAGARRPHRHRPTPAAAAAGAAALRYLKRAADGGDADAMASLGHMHAAGAGGAPASNATALSWFRRGSDRGHPSALYGLGYMALAGAGTPRDPAAALAAFRRAADAGLPEAHFQLGVMHANGWGVPASSPLAAHHFGLAARVGHVLAAHNLAMMHLASPAAPDCDKGLELLKKVAERAPEVADALNRGAAAAAAGDPGGALLAYLPAAEAGVEVAQSNAAWLLQRGAASPRDAAASLAGRLYARAARSGSVDALLRLGDAAWTGRGAPRNWARAVALYTAAAAHRSPQALFNLGYAHAHGAGAPRDAHLAKRYFDDAGAASSDGGAAAAALARWWLAAHAAWLAARPSLPSLIDSLGAALFSLTDPGPTDAPLGDARPPPAGALAAVGALLDAGGTWGRGKAGGQAHAGGAAGAEGALLAALCAGLWLVLQRRRAVRARRGTGEGGEAAAAPAPAPAAPAPGAD